MSIPYNRKRSCSESGGIQVELEAPYSPGLISETDISRFSKFTFQKPGADIHVVNNIDDDNIYLLSHMEQGIGSKLSPKVPGGDKTCAAIMKLEVLSRDIETWVKENTEDGANRSIIAILEQHSLF